MGQYWIVVNLDKHEYINPHMLGCGLKLWEQVANHPGTGTALLILTAAMPEPRGGGDLDLTVGDLTNNPPDTYQEIARRTIGRWAGDRIAVVGDYAEREDLPKKDNADLIFNLCGDSGDLTGRISSLRERAKGENSLSAAERRELEDKANRLEASGPFKDISADVCAVIEHELKGKYVGDGWRHFEHLDGL